jgi:signal transduction histidine kinase
MNSVWILHRDPQRRAAIARLAGVGDFATLAAPSDPQLDDAPRADVVLLGLADDFEVELQFAHRFAARLRHARIVLLPERDGSDRARVLFDSLDPVIVNYPPEAAALREIIHGSGDRSGSKPIPLSQRPARDAVAERFGRWFGDVELPGLLRILDPQLAAAPALIGGEPGSGRSLLARYIHTFGGGSAGALIQLVCSEDTRPEDLLDQIAAESRRFEATRSHATLWLDEVDRLSATSQRRLRSWVEWALPPGTLRAAEVRWLGTTSDPPRHLTPELQQTLATFSFKIPPLRTRPERIAALVEATAQAWASAHQRRVRSFAADAIAALTEYPWPGNLAELEAVVVQSLLAGTSDPIPAGELRYEEAGFAAVDADEIGAVLVEDTDEIGAVLAETADELDAVLATEADDEALLETFLAEDADEVAMALGEEDIATPIPEVVATEETEQRDDSGVSLRRLVGAVAHEVRNPLTTIRTFVELFPDQHQDREFREKFAELVGRGVDRIEFVVRELTRLAELTSPILEPVDVAGMLEELLEFQRETIHARRLVVLKELDQNQPLALGDSAQLRFTFEAILRKCLEIVPEGGDVYFASRHHESGLLGGPALRVLVWLHGPGAPRNGPIVPGVAPAENALEFVVAEAVVRAQRGAFALQTPEVDETILVLDLPAPPMIKKTQDAGSQASPERPGSSARGGAAFRNR